jgi:hypothetical protein
MRTRFLLLFCLAAALPAQGQEVGPALDPGAMVGWAGGEAVHRANARGSGRAAPAPRMRAKEAEARRLCARKWSVRTRLSRDHPEVRKLFALCRQAGYF